MLPMLPSPCIRCAERPIPTRYVANPRLAAHKHEPND